MTWNLYLPVAAQPSCAVLSFERFELCDLSVMQSTTQQSCRKKPVSLCHAQKESVQCA